MKYLLNGGFITYFNFTDDDILMRVEVDTNTGCSIIVKRK